MTFKVLDTETGVEYEGPQPHANSIVYFLSRIFPRFMLTMLGQLIAETVEGEWIILSQDRFHVTVCI